MEVLLIPFLIIALLCWFSRKYLLFKGKRIPRGIIILFLLLGLIPIVNIFALIGALFLTLYYSMGENACIELRETKFTKYLKG
jgi:hypothetical protein